MTDLLSLTGTDEPPASARMLRAGPLEAELVAGNLRTIRFAGHEVLRAIAYVVRDRDWGTYDLDPEDLRVEETGDGFSVSWRAARVSPEGIRLSLAASIRAEAAGRLSFDVEAVADGPFETNRCGFCILHPIEGVAGQAVAVTHSDGTLEHSVFPDLIEPSQPFKDIVAIRHAPAPGIAATCRMEGDVFEMEDQRAWSDASYKTYVRPLALPWPYRLAADEPMRQRIVLDIESGLAAPSIPRGAAAAVELSLGAATGEALPAFGLLVAPEDVAGILAAPSRLRELAPRHILFHFDPTAGHGREELAAMAGLRAHLASASAMLECVLPGERDPGAELEAAARLVEASGLAPEAVTVGPSVDRRSTPPGSAWPPCPPLEAVYAAARQAFPGARLGGGMFSYFTELNRKRPPVDLLDYVTHATCPIVHAADDLSVMQSLESIPFITRSTRAIIGPAKPYHLGPVTIGMRQNPYGSRTMPNPDGRRIAMADDDPRARGRFGAAWLVGYAARLAGSGIEAWTGGSVAGRRGLVRPDDGRPTPAFAVARGLAELSGQKRLRLASSAPGRVDGFAAAGGSGGPVVWLANLTSEPQTASLQGGEAIALAPYAVLSLPARS